MSGDSGWEFWLSIVVALISGGISYFLAERKADRDIKAIEKRLRHEVELSEAKIKREYQLEFAAETVARTLLKHETWPLRSFGIIKHHLHGFEDDGLRQILIKAGAIRFESASGKELWGLLERNQHRLGVRRIADEPGFRDDD